LALEVEKKLPWIRRKLKKISQRIERYPVLPFYRRWYRSAYNALFGKSYNQLVKEVNQLHTEEKLSNLLQGKEVCTWMIKLLICFVPLSLLLFCKVLAAELYYINTKKLYSTTSKYKTTVIKCTSQL